jgi:hypothetical protein
VAHRGRGVEWSDSHAPHVWEKRKSEGAHEEWERVMRGNQ